MDSPQSVVSPFKTASIFAESEKSSADLFVKNTVRASNGNENNQRNDDSIGILEVFVHQARDIQNICIYHKQDVYAKLCLTSNPENTVSTKIINGGGKNPVFNDNLQLHVRTIESSLKCEIWMLSRVRNYLEDQLLGFALVPLSEVAGKKDVLEREFTLSSTDLFHSPAGFVQLSLSYSGALPELIEIPAPNQISCDSESCEGTPDDFEKIEFPDPNIANENQMMLSEYFGISCTDLVSSDTENNLNSDAGVRVVESFSTAAGDSTGSPSASLPASSHSSVTAGASESPNREYISPPKENPNEKTSEFGDSESDASAGIGRQPENTFLKPVVTVSIPEQKVVQQEIVDMYMKSMQQFTESLAKMKMDIETESTSSGNSTSDQKSPATKNTGSRVFYGSRAFF